MLLFSAAGQAAYAESSIDISGDDTSIYADLWAQVLENGEDIIAFPSRVTEELDPGEVAYYGFYLAEQTDLNILLDADYPCCLLLCRKDQPVNVQTLPFSTQKIEERGIPAGYYQVYILPQEEYENEKISFSLPLGSFSEKDTCSPIGRFVTASFTKIREFYASNGSAGAVMNCDALAMTCALYPSFIRNTIQCHGSCIIEPGETWGEVLFYQKRFTYDAVSNDFDYNVTLITDVDRERFFSNYLSAIR